MVDIEAATTAVLLCFSPSFIITLRNTVVGTGTTTRRMPAINLQDDEGYKKLLLDRGVV
jgi:hypothetical protein